MIDPAKIKSLAKKFHPEIVSCRRHIHQHPELSFHEFNTQKFVEEKLNGFGIAHHRLAKTGIVALLEGKNPKKKVIALRADMDALPILETNKVEYTSAGRVVIGQAVTEPRDLVVNWQNDTHTLSLKLSDTSPSVRPNREDYATFEAFRKAHDASFRSEAQTKQARQARAYALEIEDDGSFRIEDVPPGTYELRIRVTKPDESQQRNFFGNETELG